MTCLAGKRVLITGAASGIGRLMALKCAARGAMVIAWDRDAEGLQRLQQEIPSLIGQVVDLTDATAIERGAAALIADSGAVTVVINNAGIVQGKPLLEADTDAIQRTFDVNALAPILLSRALLPAMLKAGEGHIVTVASAGGIVATARLVDYCASKFAAVGFDDALRIEARRLNWPVRTTLVAPFYINTGMFAGVKSRFPLLPILEPDYVARKVVRAIERNQQRVIMPRFVMASYLLRLLPVAWCDVLVDWLGISRSMDQFTGRTQGH